MWRIVVVYGAQLLVVWLLTLELLISNPLTMKDETAKQLLVPNNIWLTRLIDPLKQKIVFSGEKRNVPGFAWLEGEDTYSGTVHGFIKAHTLLEETDSEEQKIVYDKISKNPTSPLTRVMVMMGCYGNAQHKQEMNSETVGELFKNHNTSFMANILLNVWEVENSDPSIKQRPNASISTDIEMPHNDRSACSCLKDFASPLVLRPEGDKEIDEDLKNAGPDSCLLANVVDYTNNNKTRIDPMVYELNAYFKQIEQFYTSAPNNRYLPVESMFNTTTSQYENVTRWTSVAIAHAMRDFKPLKTLFDILSNHSSGDNIHTVGQFQEYLVKYVQSQMFAHNKLRTPKFQEGDSAKLTDLHFSQTPPEINRHSFDLYMKKYRSSYEVCAHAGVPKYQTEQLVKLVASDWGKLGVAFLLTATLFGFSTVYTRKMLEVTEGGAYIPLQYGLRFLELVVKVTAIAALGVMLGAASKKESSYLVFIIVLWWVFYLLTILNSALDFKGWSYPSGDNAKMTFEVPAKDLTKIEQQQQQQQHAGSALCRQQIAQDVAIIAGLANLAVAFRLHRGDGDVNVVLVCFILFITIGLLQHISNITRMMQQYTQQKLREALEKVQNTADSEILGFDYQVQGSTYKAVINTKTTAIESLRDSGHISYRFAYNRVLITLIVAFGLIAYLFLASSTIQVWTADVVYGEQHAQAFAWCAFFIFSAYDIFFEILVGLNYEAAEMAAQHPRKMMWTSWAIIVSLFLLHTHQFFGLCYSKRGEKDVAGGDSTCNWWNSFFYE
jgi:hypothetical protein